MKLLSRVRLGVHLGRLNGVDPTIINQLFLLVQPAHLQAHAGRALSADDLRATRAEVVRSRL